MFLSVFYYWTVDPPCSERCQGTVGNEVRQSTRDL